MKLENENKGGFFSMFIGSSGKKDTSESEAASSPAENDAAEESGDVSAQQPDLGADMNAFEDDIVVSPDVSGIKHDFNDEGWHRLAPVISWNDKERLNLQVNSASTKARIIVYSPKNDQEETFSLGTLYEALNSCGIIYGLQRDAITESFGTAPQNIPYGTPVIIAVGIEATAGVNGIVNELFPRTNKLRFDERPDGSVDFKNMHIVNNVAKGTVICDITNAVQGTVGTSIYGKPICPAPAKMPPVPRGDGVEQVDIDDMHSQLVAMHDGNLVYKDSRFYVETTFNVEGNVNNSIGNIDFTGSVTVTGDVFEGYSIKAGNNVTVYGNVEGASIYSGADINLEKGINGMGKGVLEAKGNITATFLENCTVRCGGNIRAESIVNCIVESDGDVRLFGRGVLIGGTVTAFGSVIAKTVGTRSNKLLNLTLGATPHMIRERDNLREQYKNVMAEHQSLTRDVIFLEQHSDSPDNLKKLEQYRGKLNLSAFKKARLEKRIQQLTQEQSCLVPSTLSCSTLYPPVKLTIGNDTVTVNDTCNMCRFYCSDHGEVVMGST